jgi:hypothetical protein
VSCRISARARSILLCCHALLAQVIYHLNKKNEELEFECLELADQHARDLVSQEQQAQDRLSAVSAQLADEAQRAAEQHSSAIQVI